MPNLSAAQLESLAGDIKRLGRDLGFDKLGIATTDLAADEARLERWLALGRHGTMGYMQRHGRKRSRPAELVAGTLRVISARMSYWSGRRATRALRSPIRRTGYVARYALGRDYHKVLRRALQRLADAIARTRRRIRLPRLRRQRSRARESAGARTRAWDGSASTRTSSIGTGRGFCSASSTRTCRYRRTRRSASTADRAAPASTCARRRRSSRRTSSTPDAASRISRSSCADRSPRNCARAYGNRIFGCDDCQLFCPWNKFARATSVGDFAARHGLDDTGLVELFAWSEDEWRTRTEGSALRRAGYEGWLRNIAVALGNAPPDARIVAALEARADDPSAIVREHVGWALDRQRARVDRR